MRYASEKHTVLVRKDSYAFYASDSVPEQQQTPDTSLPPGAIKPKRVIKIPPPPKIGVVKFIEENNKTFARCPVYHARYSFCQPHYRLVWVSNSRKLYQFGSTACTTPECDEKMNETDFTLIAHTTVDRLSYYKDITERWTGPIVLSIFTLWSEIPIVEDFVYRIRTRQQRFVLYIVDDREDFPPGTNCIYRDQWNATLGRNETVCIPQAAAIYPINRLRNYAIDFIGTSHFLSMDMDLWPSFGLYEALRAAPQEVLNTPFTAYALPAFQLTQEQRKICKTRPNCLELLRSDLPADKEGLLACMRRGVCQVANARLPTHRIVDRQWWVEESLVQQLKCIPYEIMEPYVLLKRTSFCPRYDENFINYGYNKVQFFDRLRHDGYSFAVLTAGFGFDIPHKPSIYADMYEESWRVNNVINMDVYDDFTRRLNKVPAVRAQEVCNRDEALRIYTATF